MSFFVAREDFSPTFDGARVNILGGITRVHHDHDLNRAFPEKFQPEAEYDAEQRPGALRAAEQRRAALTQRVRDGGVSTEGAQFPGTGTGRASTPRNPAREAGLRAIERNADVLSHAAADRLDTIIRSHDRHGVESAYVVAVSDPDYSSCFGKLLADPTHGHLRFTPQEAAAMQAVNAAEAQRGLVGGTTTAGGFALPIQIDPSIMLSSDGALCPIREVARVETMTSREWRGITSAGVTASYDTEASEVSDDSPVLAQPTMIAATGRAFVPFSIEVDQDWPSMQEELARLISDGRDVLDASMFLTGTGTDQPAGVLTGLSTTQRVLTAGTASYALADVYSLKQAIPARFMSRATWALHPTVADTTFRFTGGNSAEPLLMPTREGALLGKGKIEWTTMSTGTTTTGQKIALYGDFKAGYLIADRLGMTVELVPHLFGASGRPTAQRGIFAVWRTAAKTVNPAALRYLEVK